MQPFREPLGQHCHQTCDCVATAHQTDARTHMYAACWHSSRERVLVLRTSTTHAVIMRAIEHSQPPPNQLRGRAPAAPRGRTRLRHPQKSLSGEKGGSIFAVCHFPLHTHVTRVHVRVCAENRLPVATPLLPAEIFFACGARKKLELGDCNGCNGHHPPNLELGLPAKI